MKQAIKNIITASAVSALAFSAVAQNAPKNNPVRPGYSGDRLQSGAQSNAVRTGTGYSKDRLQDGAEYSADRTGDRDRNRMTRTNQGDQIQNVAKASDLIGMGVQNYQNEEIGTVKDFAVDVQSGRIVALIVSTGGFLGMGNELSAVPPSAFRFNTERDALQLDASKEMLSNAPHFQADQWPDFSKPENASRIYSAYEVEPYFKTTGTTNRNMDKMTGTTNKNMDKITGNVSDRNNETLTSFDQGNSKADVEVTAQIRKEITSAENMSVSGQNVKIITKDGRVTLRGRVQSMDEKRRIGEIANRIVRSGNVDNQLEVTSTTSAKAN